MYLGIDLGTSNSAIVGNIDGDTRLFKTADGTDVLPSVIFIDKRGHRFVGARAYDRTFSSPDNVASGFKRLMGTDSPIRFADAEVAWTPEQCSAEIIRTLVAQARLEGSDRPIEGAVITVPAAFNQMQSEATIRAAQEAGLEKVSLLQEPVAAAMASIAAGAVSNGMFLVYDLGGGTFDVALVQATGGSVTILAHEGINMLGGRDFDRMIIEQHVRPWLLANFKLPSDWQKAEKYRRISSIARHAVENAKIKLSTDDSATIFAGEEEVRTFDEAGSEIYISVPIQRSDIDGLIKSRVDESIALCRKVLADNGIGHEDVERVVLIGGPSKMHLIREAVPQQLGIRADQTVDPMTAVATGAAIFAESREWSGTTSKRKSTRGSEVASDGAVEVTYDYPTRTASTTARLRVKVSQGSPAGYTIEVADDSGSTTGKAPLEETMQIPLELRRKGENRYGVTISDPTGRKIEEASRSITITKTDASATAIPLTYTLAVKVQDGMVGYERNILDSLAKKGSPLPAEGTKSVRSAKELRGGKDGEIRIEFYQQTADLPDPEVSQHIGSFILNSQHDLDYGDFIKRGADLNIKWKVDDNGLLTFQIEIPDIGRSIDGRNFYVPQAGHVNFEGQSGAALASTLLSDAEEQLDEAAETLGPQASTKVAELRARAERQHLALSQSTDADTHRSVAEESRRLRQDVALLKASPENQAAALKRDLSKVEERFDTVRANADSVSQDRFDRLSATAARNIREQEFDAAERAIGEMNSIHFEVVWRDADFLIGILGLLVEERYFAHDVALHDRLAQEGVEAARSRDVPALQAVVARMMNNRVMSGGAGKEVAKMADLLKK